MILPHGAIVAVADGATLKLFRNRGMEPHLELIEIDRPKIVPVNAGTGLRHHNEAANPDRHRKVEDGFAAASANHLNNLALDGTLEGFFVIADPRTLGESRKHFHPSLQAKILGEVAKDLTDHSVRDIGTTI